eukprot:3049733-Amphidinium_carterae.1
MHENHRGNATVLESTRHIDKMQGHVKQTGLLLDEARTRVYRSNYNQVKQQPVNLCGYMYSLIEK